MPIRLPLLTLLCLSGASLHAAPKPAKTPAATCSTAASKGSCVQANGDSCIDYTGEKWTAASIKSECSSGWSYSAAPCAAAATVGLCAYSSSMFKGMESVQRHYAKGGMSSAQAEAYCKGNTSMTGVFCAP